MTGRSFVNASVGENKMNKKYVIMEKAIELFTKQGFTSTSIQQITDECGISKGAFYLSFNSKKELIMAIIDHFMMQFHEKIDNIVNHTEKENMLYTFYYNTYEYFYKHINFAKFFLKELPSLSLNHNDLHVLIRSHDKQIEKTILRIVEKIYDQSIERLKYDLVYCIKHFIGMYTELLIHQTENIDFQLLAKSLADKTNILAKYMSIPFMTKDLFTLLEEQNKQFNSDK